MRRGHFMQYKVFVGTWNVGGEPPDGDFDLGDWLDTNNDFYDIYVLGFQEIVPLSLKNILSPEKSRSSKKWNSLISTTLNKLVSNRERSIAQSFRCIVTKQMVGIFVSVWVRADLRRHIRHQSVSCVECGIMGWLGNKGSVSVRLCLHGTSLCFVCCHMASGGMEGGEVRRNLDAAQILSRTRFCRCHVLDLPEKILDHDGIILFGDLNYRISLPEAKTRLLVEQKEWNILLENDQLLNEASCGRVFEGWQEGIITFPPTYKYCPNSDEYYGCLGGTKVKKKRAPAWCDRIIWHGKGLKESRYERCELKLSDHRPVRAVFTVVVEVETLKNTSRSVRDFLSEKFDSEFISALGHRSQRIDHVTKQFDLFLDDDRCNGRSSFHVHSCH